MKEKKSSYFTATWKMLAAVIIGGIAGGVSVVIYELMKKGIDAGIRTINGTIQQYIFPALIIQFIPVKECIQRNEGCR